MAGRQFTYPQLERLWVQAGGRRSMAAEMAAIAEVESSGDSAPTPGKYGNNPDTATGLPGAIGLWQMEWPLYAGLAGVQTPQAALDPLNNARMAVKLAGQDPSTAPGHPVYDNWVQWESTIGGQPAYLSYLNAGAGGLLDPGGGAAKGIKGGAGGLVPSVESLAIAVPVVLAAVALGVWGIARAASSARTS